MPLTIIKGAAGSGKTTQLYEKIIESAYENPELLHVVLVPEQATLQVEGRLVAMHKNHILLNIEVLSFNKLAMKLFEYENMAVPAFLDEAGKAMLIRKAGRDREKDLSVFSNSMDKNGTIEHIKASLSELIRYGISADELEKISEKEDVSDLLAGKLKDISTLYRSYMSLKTDGSMSVEELQSRAAAMLGRSDYLTGAIVAMDGFTGFTPVQYSMIRDLIKRCKKVSVTLTLPDGETADKHDDYSLYSITKRTAAGLEDAASFCGIKTEYRCVKTDRSKIGRPADLVHLSDYFMSPAPGEPYAGEPKGLTVTACKSPLEEAEYVASSIVNLIRKEGYRFKDIAVVSADIEGTAPYLKRAFKEAGIASFIDAKEGIMGQAVSVMLLSAVEIIEKGYTFEPVMRFIKTGFTDLSLDETDKLENYLIGTGITGRKKWSSDFSRVFKNHSAIDFLELNDIRKRAIISILKFHGELMDGARDYVSACAAIRTLMDDLHVEEKLLSMSEEQNKAGDLLGAGVCAQLFEKINTFLHQLEEILGDRKFTLRELRDILKSGLGQVSVSSVPPVFDQVQAGDIRRSRLGKTRALFFIDCNECYLPSRGFETGVFSDDQREILASYGIELAPSARQSAVDEQFYIHELISNPKDRLYLVFCSADRAGNAISPSPYISHICGLFNNISVSEYSADIRRYPEYKTDAVRQFASLIGKAGRDDFTSQLYSSLSENDRPAVDRILDAAFYTPAVRKIENDLLERLYRGDLSVNASLLRTFAGCPYKYFLSAVMRIGKREAFELSQLERGTIIHALLEDMFRQIKDDNMDILTLDSGAINRLAESSTRSVIRKYGDFIEDSARDKYYIERFRRIVEKYFSLVPEIYSTDEYVPYEFERSFSGGNYPGLRYEIGSGKRIIVTGRIDRVDIKENDAGRFVRVIDYKTGSAKFDLSNAIYGLDLQLPLYLTAAREIYEKSDGRTVTEGAFIAQIDDKNADIKGADYNEAAVRQALVNELKLDGVCIEAADEAKEDEALFSRNNLDLLIENTDALIKKFGESIIEGLIPASPCGIGGSKPCDYCEYIGTCGVVESCADNGFKKLKKISKNDWVEVLRKEAGADEMDR